MLAWTLTRGSEQKRSGQPPNLLKAGTTNMLNVTTAEAGFPGRANIHFVESPTGTEAKVVGFPGLMATRPKWIVPFKCRSMTGFKRSEEPMDEPPVVRSTSAASSPLFIVCTCASILQNVRRASENRYYSYGRKRTQLVADNAKINNIIPETL